MEFIRVNLFAVPVKTLLPCLCLSPSPRASLPSKKAPGCDEVNAKILKDNSPLIAPIITGLILNSPIILLISVALGVFAIPTAISETGLEAGTHLVTLRHSELFHAL